MDEENKINIENNDNGGGNPYHDEEGKFTTKEGNKEKEDDSLGVLNLKESEFPVEETFLSSKLKSLVAKKKEAKDAEAKKFQESIELDEEKRKYCIELPREKKLAVLGNSPVGYSTEKLHFATDEQLNSLLMAEMVCNKRIELEQDFNILEKKKEELKKKIDNELAQNNIDEFSGIWYGSTKHPSDWAVLQSSGSIDKKKEYYNNVLINKNSKMEQKIQAKFYLKQLDKFETLGKEYEKLKGEQELKHLDEVEDILAKQTAIKSEIAKFSDSSPLVEVAKEYKNKFVDFNSTYSPSRKNNATWINNKWKQEHSEYLGMSNSEAGIKYFGKKFEEIWKTLSSSEQSQVIDYTGGGYSKYNKPLRGKHHGGWSGFNFAKAVTNLSNAIDKCVWDEDIWVQRGIGHEKMFKLPGGSKAMSLTDMSDDQLKLLEGTSFTDNGFFSCGAGKETGFSHNPVIFNVYCPKGTKMAYAATHGHFSSENEMILQRGYTFRINKVEHKDGRYYLDIDVILGSDKDKITDFGELSKIGQNYLG